MPKEEEATGKGWKKKEGLAVRGQEVQGSEQGNSESQAGWNISKCAWEAEEGKAELRKSLWPWVGFALSDLGTSGQ